MSVLVAAGAYAHGRSVDRGDGVSETRWPGAIPVLRKHWVSALTISIGIIVLMYSTFGTNLTGLWDASDSFFNGSHATFNTSTNTWQACKFSLALHLNACRQDIVGGLFYWLSQHKVARGGQPWFYYFLIYGLYEQIALLFGGIAIVRTFVGRAMTPGIA